MLIEYKSLPLEIDSLSKEKGTAVIAHAVYNNIDLGRDIARKGMFDKTWKEKKMADGFDISFYLNHNEDAAPGKVTRVFDNEQKAFTEVKMGTHTLGVDTLKMMDEGIARKASFGFFTMKSNPLKKEGKALRELKEVDHLESSILTKLSMNPGAGLIKVNKSFSNLQIEFKALDQSEQNFLRSMIGAHQSNLEKLVNFSGTLDPTSDLYTYTQYWISSMNSSIGDMKSQMKYNCKSADSDVEVKAHIERLKKFVRNTSASDDTIKEMELEIKSLEQTLYLDTDDTRLIDEPLSSVEGVETKQFADELHLLTLKF
jgi:hypothetical protein